MKVIGNYKEAAKLFEENELYLKSFECYESEGDWEDLLLCLNRNKDKFQAAERDALIRRFLPFALNSLYQSLTQRGDEENREKLMKEKYENQDIGVIKEESDSSDDEGMLLAKIIQPNLDNKEQKKDERNEHKEEEDVIPSLSEPNLEQLNKSEKLNESETSTFSLSKLISLIFSFKNRISSKF